MNCARIRAYTSKAVRAYLRRITATIPEKRDVVAARQRKGSQGGRPPIFAAESHKGRNVVERRLCDFKRWRGLVTRYDKHALVYRAGVLIASVVAWLKKL